MKKILLILAYLSFSVFAFAQENPIKWKSSVKQDGTTAELILEAKIPKGYHLYSQYTPMGGPLPMEIKYPKSKDYNLVGKTSENPAAHTVYDKEFETNIKVLESGTVKFSQKINVLSEKDFKIKGTIDYQVCTEESCFPYNDVPFSFDVKGVAQTAENVAAAAEEQTQEIAKVEEVVESVIAETPSEAPAESENIWNFILLAMLAGFAAVLTPCVFPMIPMNISFFMQGNSKKSQGVIKGAIFTLSIAAIYTLIGVVVALTKSADFANVLSSHWIANLIFFLLFVLFAFSFFGLFEITLPSSFSNKLDAQADKGGYFAAFFMAAVLTIVSFSCTGPFVATLLVQAAMGTSALKPILGMMAFGLAMGSPFFILALSPSLISKMPKSGGWLNSVKVVFAFILLAFSLKFLLTIDTVYNFNIFTREAYLAIWIVIFALMGLYLMGKIKFSHDSDLKHIGIFRLMLIIATFSFVVYLIPGMFGAPLKMISTFIPSETAQQFKMSSGAAEKSTRVNNLCGTAKYADFLHMAHDIPAYFDYEQGLACAKEKNMPVLLDFKGHGCGNCKKMDAEVLSDPRVLALIDKYIVIGLYTDDKTELPENEWITSTVDGNVKSTMGKKNLDLQITKFKSNGQPFFMPLDASGNQLAANGATYSSDIEKFIKFFEEGLANFEKSKK